MDCMKDWTDRVDEPNLHRLLELGETLNSLPQEYKAYRAALMANSLFADGTARSQEDAYVMLMEVYAYAQVKEMMDVYDKMCMGVPVVPKRIQLRGTEHDT